MAYSNKDYEDTDVPVVTLNNKTEEYSSAYPITMNE